MTTRFIPSAKDARAGVGSLLWVFARASNLVVTITAIMMYIVAIVVMGATLAVVTFPLVMLAAPIGVASLLMRRDFQWGRAYLKRLAASQLLGRLLTPFDAIFAGLNILVRLADKAVLKPMLAQAHRMLERETLRPMTDAAS